MKILIAGDWCWCQYEKAIADALVQLGHEVVQFSFHDFFQGKLGHYQSALPLPGPALWKLNRALLKSVRDSNPRVVLIWRGTHVLPQTVRLIKAEGVLTVSYNNDDPFGPLVHGNTPWHHHLLWMWYLRCLKDFNLNFVYRLVNVQEAISFGARNVYVLKPYFIPWQDRPVVLSEQDKRRFACDVVFVGHYEPDGREEYLRALVNAGLHVRLFGGPYWTDRVLGELATYFGDISQANGEDYAKARCGAKMCLALLSKMNRDTYTRRCFEIPACGRVMLAERTDDLLSMFVEDKEACFFSSSEELVAKAKWVVANPNIADEIAQAGLRRVWADGHDVKSRAAEFIAAIQGHSIDGL